MVLIFFLASRVRRGTTRHPGYPLAYQLSRRVRVSACLRVLSDRRRATKRNEADVVGQG